MRTPSTTNTPRHRPISAVLGLSIAAALLVTAMTGCGSRTSVTSTWQEERSAAGPVAHVLVVGVSPSARLRRSFEEALAAEIVRGGTKASASVRIGGATRELSRDSVAEMVRATGADSVLVTRLASSKVALREGETRVGVKTERPSSLTDGPGLVELFSQTYHEYEEPGEITRQSKVVIESSLYEAKDGGRLVYTILTRSEFDEEKDDVIGDVSAAIARRLRADGLIR